MNEFKKQDESSVDTPNETDVVVLIKQVQKQLGFLERKIDMLVGRPQGRSFDKGNKPHGPSFQEKHFSRPRKFFDRFQKPGNRGQHYRSDSGASNREYNYDKFRGGEQRQFDRDSEHQQGNRFDKRPKSKPGHFAKKGKKFSRRKKF